MSDLSLSVCCFCGGHKLGWKIRCVICGKEPTSVPDVVASSILCSSFLPMPELLVFQQHIQKLGHWRPSRELLGLYHQQTQTPPPNEKAAELMATMMIRAVVSQRRVESEVGERMGVGFGKESPSTAEESERNTLRFLRFVYRAAAPAAITGLLCAIFLHTPGQRILGGLFCVVSFGMGAWAFSVYQKSGGK
jgi:hypothetical protein